MKIELKSLFPCPLCKWSKLLVLRYNGKNNIRYQCNDCDYETDVIDLWESPSEWNNVWYKHWEGRETAPKDGTEIIMADVCDEDMVCLVKFVNKGESCFKNSNNTAPHDGWYSPAFDRVFELLDMQYWLKFPKGNE